MRALNAARLMGIMHFTRLGIIAIGALFTVGCSKLPSLPDLSGTKIPGVYRIDIQQGNVLAQENLAQIETGLSKRKVRFLLGTPAVNDLFNADRWDYIYTFSKRGGPVEKRHLAMRFEDDTLIEVNGLNELLAELQDTPTRETVVVDVPKGRSDGSIFGRLTRPLRGSDRSISDSDSAAIALTPDDPRLDPQSER
ncbi:MAG: outer membrane protein assembly factor BamE [Pseudomonadota bacterium]